MHPTLTAAQKALLRTALVLHEANGAGTRRIKGRGYEALVKKGLFRSVLGRSTSGGNAARWYVFTDEGLDVARSGL